MEDEKQFETIEDVLTEIDNVSGLVGGTEEGSITKILDFLTGAKEYLSTVSSKIAFLETDLETVSKRCLELQSANNKLMKKVITSEEDRTETKEDIEKVSELTDFFDVED